MPGIVMKPKVLRRVKDRAKDGEKDRAKPPSPRKGQTRPKENPRREVDISPTAENEDQMPPSPSEEQTRPKKNPYRSTKKMAKGGMVCRGGGAATKGTKYTRNG